MAKIRYDGTGVTPSDFSVFPAGDYHLVITGYTEKSNKHGLPSYRIECTVDDVEKKEAFGKKCWHGIHILPKENRGAGIAVHFLKTIGEPWEGEYDIDADNWVGKRFHARVMISRNDYNGKDENEIVSIKPVVDGKAADLLTREKWQRSMQEAGEVPF